MIRVLVVDDEKLVRQGIISSLPWDKFDMQVVGEAKNGEKAVEFLEGNEIDLMLTDLAMPVMSGIELMRIVRKRYPDLYIIVLTLHQDFEYIQEALRLGAIDYIAKVELVQERFHEILERIHTRIAEEERKKGGQSEGPSDRDSRDAARNSHAAGAGLNEAGQHRVPAGRDAGEADPDRDPQSIASMRHPERIAAEAAEIWSGLGWIHDDEQFAANLERLRRLEPTAEELVLFLRKQAEAWNGLYGSSPADGRSVPDSIGGWSEAEAWLREARSLLGRSLDAPNYSQEVQDAVAKAVQYIQQQLDGQLYAADIAKRVNMSRSYFSQCFRDITGKTFNDYVRHARVDKAKEYLLHTNKPVLWIAEKTGYMDGKYFSNVFRDQTGMLPSAFRKEHRRESGH